LGLRSDRLGKELQRHRSQVSSSRLSPKNGEKKKNGEKEVRRKFLGGGRISLECVARFCCQDHKFDPITQHDYYGTGWRVAKRQSWKKTAESSLADSRRSPLKLRGSKSQRDSEKAVDENWAKKSKSRPPSEQKEEEKEKNSNVATSQPPLLERTPGPARALQYALGVRRVGKQKHRGIGPTGQHAQGSEYKARLSAERTVAVHIIRAWHTFEQGGGPNGFDAAIFSTVFTSPRSKEKP